MDRLADNLCVLSTITQFIFPFPRKQSQTSHPRKASSLHNYRKRVSNNVITSSNETSSVDVFVRTNKPVTANEKGSHDYSACFDSTDGEGQKE
jgi:hypothetical protein